MLKLKTPLVIYPHTYPALVAVRVEIEARAQRVTVDYGPAQEVDGKVTLGTYDETTGQTVAPAPVRSVTLAQNFTAPDPAVDALFQDLTRVLEQIDRLVASSQHEPGGLAEAALLLGEQEWSLEHTFEGLGARGVGVRKLRLRDHPAPPLPPRPGGQGGGQGGGQAHNE